MKNIFVYGSLMFDDVWNRVVKRRYQKQPALLPGYRRMAIRGKSYPGLIKSVNSSVQGVIYFNVFARDIKRLDKFEGRYYRKVPVTVLCENNHKHHARAYLFVRHKINLLAHKPWSPACFQAHHLHSFIARYK
jgi:gamma-glutamylcyclotransferase (GGCT)/AIG2-like uncharacterized protein YtfP